METDIEKLTEIVGEMARKAVKAEWDKMNAAIKDVDDKVNEAYRRGCEDTRFLLDLENSDFEKKPFDMLAYTPETDVQTRDGRHVKVLCIDAVMDDGKPVIAIIKGGDKNGTDIIEYYYGNGRVNNNGVESDFDLMFVTKKNVGYVNVYVTKEGTYELGSENIYDTQKEAFNARKTTSTGVTYVCTTKIKWFNRRYNLKK